MATLSLKEVVEMLVAVRDRSAKGDEDVMRFLAHALAHLTHSRSQFLQDLWVDYELKGRTNGFFVEFGAADGLHFSNSLYLERQRGWRGILSEPARVWHPHVRYNRACYVDERCVWTRSGERLAFNEPQIALHATLDAFTDSDSLADTRKDGARYEVETISLADLLAYWQAPRRIDYLSIDTEGSEFDILSAFDFGAYEIRLITVEHNHTDKRDAIHQLLTAKGYRRKFETLSNVDDWYVRTY